MQATASLEELQSLQVMLHQGPVRISLGLHRRRGSSGWMRSGGESHQHAARYPLRPRVSASQTPARLQATTVLGFSVITQAPCWPATIKQHFLCSFMRRNSSNWISCTEEDLFLNAQHKCRRALGCVVGAQHSSKLFIVRGAIACFQVESRLLAKIQKRKQ